MAQAPRARGGGDEPGFPFPDAVRRLVAGRRFQRNPGGAANPGGQTRPPVRVFRFPFGCGRGEDEHEPEERHQPMTARPLLSIVTAAVAAGCAGPAGPSPTDPLTYGIPSPPTAVYHVDDTMAIDMASPLGGMKITGEGSTTMGLAFRSDPGGMRVVGTVEAFEGSMTHPMMGTQTAGPDDLSGNLEVVIGPAGVEELASFPELAGPLAMMSSFPALGYLIFPRMPGGDVGPGATWVDTVTASTETEGASMTTTTVSTYTLVGDTVVDGRSLVRIAVANQVRVETSFEEGGMSITQDVAGSTDGFVLWDPGRRLVAYARYEREMEGTMSMGPMGSMDLTITGPTRLRLDR